MMMTDKELKDIVDSAKKGKDKKPEVEETKVEEVEGYVAEEVEEENTEIPVIDNSVETINSIPDPSAKIINILKEVVKTAFAIAVIIMLYRAVQDPTVFTRQKLNLKISMTNFVDGVVSRRSAKAAGITNPQEGQILLGDTGDRYYVYTGGNWLRTQDFLLDDAESYDDVDVETTLGFSYDQEKTNNNFVYDIGDDSIPKEVRSDPKYIKTNAAGIIGAGKSAIGDSVCFEGVAITYSDMDSMNVYRWSEDFNTQNYRTYYYECVDDPSKQFTVIYNGDDPYVREGDVARIYGTVIATDYRPIDGVYIAAQLIEETR